MRLWHKNLIPVLPRQQLLGQWRECCLIAKNIATKGSPNHILVNRIMEYDRGHFWCYCMLVVNEMRRRKYDVDISKVKKWISGEDMKIIPFSKIFDRWHNGRYYQQCFYNLEEKYDCGGITREEWTLIVANNFRIFS